MNIYWTSSHFCILLLLQVDYSSHVDYKVLHDSGRKFRKTSDSEIETLSSSFKNISIMANINKFKSTEKEIVEEIKDCILLNNLLSIEDIDMINEYR